jgi:hypothetical protein
MTVRPRSRAATIKGMAQSGRSRAEEDLPRSSGVAILRTDAERQDEVHDDDAEIRGCGEPWGKGVGVFER